MYFLKLVMIISIGKAHAPKTGSCKPVPSALPPHSLELWTVLQDWNLGLLCPLPCPLTAQDRMGGRGGRGSHHRLNGHSVTHRGDPQILPSKAGVGGGVSEDTWADCACKNLGETSANRSQQFTLGISHLPQEHKTRGTNLIQFKNIALAPVQDQDKQAQK